MWACPGSTSRHLAHLHRHPPQVKAKLKELFGAAYVEPTAAFINRWAADPLARGSYSYAALGSANPGTDRTALGSAEGRLLFAGEHTSRWYYGTVAGAYSSGRAAATRLLSCKRLGSASC
jgi:monoamine oxidase